MIYWWSKSTLCWRIFSKLLSSNNTTMYSTIVVYVCSRNDNGGIFKNLHFETRFQKYAFSVPKTPLSCKRTGKMHKKFPVFGWKRCRVNCPWVWNFRMRFFIFVILKICHAQKPCTLSRMRINQWRSYGWAWVGPGPPTFICGPPNEKLVIFQMDVIY